MGRDLRDPTLLGAAILKMAKASALCLRAVADIEPSVPNYSADPGPLEKYGCPQDLPSTLPN